MMTKVESRPKMYADSITLEFLSFQGWQASYKLNKNLFNKQYSRSKGEDLENPAFTSLACLDMPLLKVDKDDESFNEIFMSSPLFVGRFDCL